MSKKPENIDTSGEHGDGVDTFTEEQIEAVCCELGELLQEDGSPRATDLAAARLILQARAERDGVLALNKDAWRRIAAREAERDAALARVRELETQVHALSGGAIADDWASEAKLRQRIATLEAENEELRKEAIERENYHATQRYGWPEARIAENERLREEWDAQEAEARERDSSDARIAYLRAALKGEGDE